LSTTEKDLPWNYERSGKETTIETTQKGNQGDGAKRVKHLSDIDAILFVTV